MKDNLLQNSGQLEFTQKILTSISLGICSVNSLCGNTKGAVGILKQALKINPNNPKLNWKLGSLYLKSLETKEAIYYFQEAVRLDNRNPEYVLGLSIAYDYAGQKSLAYNFAEEVLKRKPESSEAWCIKGRIQAENEQLERALQYFNIALEINNKNIYALNEKGCLLLKMNKILDGIEIFNVAIDIHPKDTNLLLNIGLAYIKLENYENALSFLTKAQNHKLNSPILYNALGLCYCHLDNVELAKESYLKALELNPDNPETLCNLATINARLGKYNLSLESYRKAIQKDPYNGAILNNAAWCLEKIGNHEEAIKYYYRALAIDSPNEVYRINLAECLYQAGYIQEAIDQLEYLVEKENSNRKAWGILGKIYDSLKQYSKAIDCHNKALGLE